MRQVVHIFKKDLRHLWPQALLVLVLIAMFTWLNAQSQALAGQTVADGSSEHWLRNFIPFLLQVGFWYLIAAAVILDAVPGEEQFWVTRPYSRLSLALAKMLFIVISINLPMLVAHCVILQTLGFRATSYIGALLFGQVLLFAVWLFPVAALAAVCRNFWQFLGAGLAIMVTGISFSIGGIDLFPVSWQGVAWLRWCMVIAILSAASLIILICQYRQRRTAMARLIAACGLLLALTLPYLPSQGELWALQFAMLPLPAPNPSIQITFDPAKMPSRYLPSIRYDSIAEIDLPLHLTGIPDATELETNYVGFSIEGQQDSFIEGQRGSLWKGRISYAIYQAPDAAFWLRMVMDKPLFERFKDQTVTVHVSAYLALIRSLGAPQLVAPDTLQNVPEWGHCMFHPFNGKWSFGCVSPLRRPLRWAYHRFISDNPRPPSVGDAFDPGYQELESYSPLPAQAGLSPLVMVSTASGSNTPPPIALKITVKRPVATTRCDFDIPAIHLADYEVHMP